MRSMRMIPLLASLLLLGGCSGNWGWYVVNPASPAGQRNLMFLIDGLYYTIALSVTAILISIIVGLLIALPGLARARPARMVNRVYVELVRAVPILVLICGSITGCHRWLISRFRCSGQVFWRWRFPTVRFRPKFSALESSPLIGASMRRRIPFR